MQILNHYDATSVADAVAQLNKYGSSAKVMAGGTELLHTIKGNIHPNLPSYIINIKTIPGLNSITTSSTGLKIGALCTLTSVATNSNVLSTYPMLAQAASAVATNQIRNLGTIGGNLSQEVWCWYYRWEHNQFYCLRKGGSTCYAQSGVNTFHSIFGGPGGCYSVHPSDTAIALLALGASVVTSSRTIPISQFFKNISPGNVLANNEIITEIDVPTPPANALQVFTKFKFKQSFDFAVVSVGLLAAPTTGSVTTANIWLGGVGPVPIEATGAEAALKGNAISSTVATAAGAAAIANAVPLPYNHYKKNIVSTLVSRAIMSTT